MTKSCTLADHPAATAASRRSVLKGVGALLGTGLLAGPLSLLAQPAAAASAPTGAKGLALGSPAEYLGMVKLLDSPAVPLGWAPCDGGHLPASQHPALFGLLGTLYGGDGQHTFALPNLTAGPARPVATGLPARPIAGTDTRPHYAVMKVADAAATAAGGAELRLLHHCRSRRQA